MEWSGETEVCNLQSQALVDQEILWLQVAVKNAIGVAELHALKELEREVLHSGRREIVAHGAHVLLQIVLNKLKDQDQLVGLVENIDQFDNILVIL